MGFFYGVAICCLLMSLRPDRSVGPDRIGTRPPRPPPGRGVGTGARSAGRGVGRELRSGSTQRKYSAETGAPGESAGRTRRRTFAFAATASPRRVSSSLRPSPRFAVRHERGIVDDAEGGLERVTSPPARGAGAPWPAGREFGRRRRRRRRSQGIRHRFRGAGAGAGAVVATHAEPEAADGGGRRAGRREPCRSDRGPRRCSLPRATEEKDVGSAADGLAPERVETPVRAVRGPRKERAPGDGASIRGHPYGRLRGDRAVPTRRVPRAGGGGGRQGAPPEQRPEKRCSRISHRRRPATFLLPSWRARRAARQRKPRGTPGCFRGRSAGRNRGDRPAPPAATGEPAGESIDRHGIRRGLGRSGRARRARRARRKSRRAPASERAPRPTKSAGPCRSTATTAPPEGRTSISRTPRTAVCSQSHPACQPIASQSEPVRSREATRNAVRITAETTNRSRNRDT